MNIKPLIQKVFTRKYQFALQPAAVELIEEILPNIVNYGPENVFR